MKLLSVVTLALAGAASARSTFKYSDTPPQGVPKHLREVGSITPQYAKRQTGPGTGPDQTANGVPIDNLGRGAPILGGTNEELDLQNPDNLGRQTTDNGVVPNLKWSFSDSRTRLLNGGWVRESVITDLPSSKDISGAQQHLKKGAQREFHWHKVAEWGYVYSGRVLVTATDEEGRNQAEVLEVGDIWYFPKGQAHGVQGLADENEYLLVFDEGDFDAVGTTFNLEDWLAKTPRSVLARTFGVNASVFAGLPAAAPYIVPYPKNQTFNDPLEAPVSPYGSLEGNSSYVYHLSKQYVPEDIGGGGTIAIVDSRNFPVSTTIASAIVTLKPGGIRPLHWHPNAEEWLYFHKGHARATVFIGSATSRTFDFSAGDTAVFPDNSGHYVENLSQTEELVWIELYKSDHVASIEVSQWLATTPAEQVARTLNVSVDVVRTFSKEKRLLLP